MNAVDLTRRYTPPPIDLIAELQRLAVLDREYYAAFAEAGNYTEEVYRINLALDDQRAMARSALQHAGIDPDSLGRALI